MAAVGAHKASVIATESEFFKLMLLKERELEISKNSWNNGCY
jgi:hypothetical protein